MARRFGPLLPVLLLGLLVLIQLNTAGRGERVLAGETAARELLTQLGTRSASRASPKAAHPGLDALDDERALEALPLPASDLEIASNASYLFALSRSSRRDSLSNQTVHGWELRAWPRDFGRTGDAEYVFTEAGELFESRNPRGRSGTTRGFPPPAREAAVHESGGGWWRRQASAHK